MAEMWARVDDRLIHGQVVVGWRRFLRYGAICVVDDVAAGDSVLGDVLRLAVPAGVALAVCTAAEVSGVLAGSTCARTLLLFRSPQAVLGAMEAGLALRTLCVGNLAASPGSVRVLRSISLAPAQAEALGTLAARGVAIVFQPTPEDVAVRWETVRDRHF
jgi:mannose/fructose/N-acetylgalactosamine-specific phosphotransferase system component IIB